MKASHYFSISIFLILFLVIPHSVLSQIPSGDIAPLGTPDGQVNVGDALVALRFSLGLEPGHPTADELSYGDVAPLHDNHQPNPDGQITVGDALVILRKALGLVNWPCTDIDSDGYYAESGFGTEVDCNDFDSNIHPGAPELDDGIDNNCDGQIDEGVYNNYLMVSAGNAHSLGVKSDGTLWAWGRNEDGELGDGTITNRHSPVQIGSDTTWAMVSAGSVHSLAVKSDGTLWAWGYNKYGQLGAGTATDRYSPVQIGSDTTWAMVSASQLHSLAVKSDGTLWAWGHNEDGELGDETTTDRHSPVNLF